MSSKVSHYTHSSVLYRCLNRSLGGSLRRSHSERDLIPPTKQVAYKLPRTKGGRFSPKRVPRLLFSQNSTHSNRQQNCGCLYKGRRCDVGSTVCPIVNNPDLVLQETGNSQGPIYSRPAECGSRQAIQARPDHPKRVVSLSRGLPVDMHQVA